MYFAPTSDRRCRRVGQCLHACRRVIDASLDGRASGPDRDYPATNSISLGRHCFVKNGSSGL